ncbi:MAG TPA: DUF2752 domain-containing protein [Thermoanaerobaculia bacterium]|jgi:hypothetical protein
MRPNRLLATVSLPAVVETRAGAVDGSLSTRVEHHARLKVTRTFAAAPIAFVAVFSLSQLGQLCGASLSFCVAQRIFGVRCPGCGVTRSVAALLRGDLAAAVSANVAGPVVCAYFVVGIVCLVVAMLSPLQQQNAVLGWSRRNDRMLSVSLVIAWLWHFGVN